jgi:hypothetical protein
MDCFRVENIRERRCGPVLARSAKLVPFCPFIFPATIVP